MNLKNILLSLVLALVHLPLVEAHAQTTDTDTFSCGTRWPFWWRHDGPRMDIFAQGWDIQPIGDTFRITFVLVNRGTQTFEGGMGYRVTHAAVDPVGYPDPTSRQPPPSARSQLGAEALTSGRLPTLRPGERAVVSAYARAFRADANHILTVTFYDKGQIPLRPDPDPEPWYWLRILSPRATPDALELVRAAVEPTSSTREGYSARRVWISLKNVSNTVLEAGTPVVLVHGSSGSAQGYWGPDDDIDPNDPGNPYASFFRETIQVRLVRPVAPGQVLDIGGEVNIPEGFTSLQQMTVSVGN